MYVYIYMYMYTHKFIYTSMYIPQFAQVAMVRQQFQVLQTALEEEKGKTKSLSSQVDSECEEASRVRERLAQVIHVHVYRFVFGLGCVCKVGR